MCRKNDALCFLMEAFLGQHDNAFIIFDKVLLSVLI